MSELVEKIKEEVRKRIKVRNQWLNEEKDASDLQVKTWQTLNGEDESILQFIDSLPEEHNEDLESQYKSNMRYQHGYTQDDLMKTKSDDLEEEIVNWRHNHFHGRRDKDASGEYLERESQLDLARHFAEWQEKKMLGIAEAFYEQGRFEQKQEMIKDAVEGTVMYEIGSAVIPQCDRRYQVLSNPTPITNAKLGDKVKIIIVKEEQQ